VTLTLREQLVRAVVAHKLSLQGQRDINHDDPPRHLIGPMAAMRENAEPLVDEILSIMDARRRW
jgi:hypothetical protein